jgi:hypothetical protein
MLGWILAVFLMAAGWQRPQTQAQGLLVVIHYCSGFLLLGIMTVVESVIFVGRRLCSAQQKQLDLETKLPANQNQIVGSAQEKRA